MAYYVAAFVIFHCVVRKAYPPDEIAAKEEEEHYPQTKEYFAVEDVPTVCQVGNREKFQGEGYLYES